MQSVAIPYEARNKYRIHLLPPNKKTKRDSKDNEGWGPTAEEVEELESFLFAHEESFTPLRTLLTCLGCRNIRPLKMHFALNGATGDVMLIDRPYRCGGWLCGNNLTATTYTKKNDHDDFQKIGRIRENFSPYLSKFLTCWCQATSYIDIDRALPDGKYETKYTLRTNICCCGRSNNCCGGTCFNRDAVYDILDTNGDVVAHLQQTFASDETNCCRACCRAYFEFHAYILEFPLDSTAEDRMLLLTALFEIQYAFFQKQ